VLHNVQKDSHFISIGNLNYFVCKEHAVTEADPDLRARGNYVMELGAEPPMGSMVNS